MGRPPCCHMAGLKKGPWTPEEDLLLAAYIQEHGPRNWRAVPTNIGLLRCSKSCRLRWTNYLRPGLKRGNFTEQEEKLILQLQELLGNRWAAIASYMPQRTDNDIKNYWNTHLKKKVLQLQAGNGDRGDEDISESRRGSCVEKTAVPRWQWERRLQTNIQAARQALHKTLSLAPTNGSALMPIPRWPARYSSSVENIARLLAGWMCPVGVAGKSREMSTTVTEKQQLKDTPILMLPSKESAPVLERWMCTVSFEGSRVNQLDSSGLSSIMATTDQLPRCHGDEFLSVLASHTDTLKVAAAAHAPEDTTETMKIATIAHFLEGTTEAMKIANAAQTPDGTTEATKIACAGNTLEFSTLESWLLDDGMGTESRGSWMN